MISMHNCFERGSLHVVSPFAKSANNSQEFAVVSLIVSLWSGQSLRIIGNRMLISIDIALEQHCSCGEERSISFNFEGSVIVSDYEHGFRGICDFQCFESGVFGSRPFPLLCLLHKDSQRLTFVRVVIDKSMVKVAESDETA